MRNERAPARRGALLAIGACLLGVVTLLALWTVRATVPVADGPAGAGAEATLDTTPAQPGAACGPPSVCSPEEAFARAEDEGRYLGFLEWRTVDAWVARQATVAQANEIFGSEDLQRHPDAVIWLVAVRFAAQPYPTPEAPSSPYPAYPYPFPRPTPRTTWVSEGALLTLQASDGSLASAGTLAAEGEDGVHYSDVEALPDRTDLAIPTPTPWPSATPTERCGPFVLCTAQAAVGAALGADGFNPDQHTLDPLAGWILRPEAAIDETTVDPGRAVVRLVPIGLVRDKFEAVEEVENECLDNPAVRPNQLAWLVALPFAAGDLVTYAGHDSAHEVVVRGTATLLSPADDSPLAQGVVWANPADGLTLEEVASWESAAMPESPEEAPPPCDF